VSSDIVWLIYSLYKAYKVFVFIVARASTIVKRIKIFILKIKKTYTIYTLRNESGYINRVYFIN
jgi:hypothetical protein